MAPQNTDTIRTASNLTVSNFTIENGGGAVLRADNEITIFYTNNSNCP